MTIHTFEPDHYYVAIGTHPPVLRIADGDTVRTKTIDARGQDQQVNLVSERGNPQTGPFYVEGAEPGDALAVTFDVIAPEPALRLHRRRARLQRRRPRLRAEHQARKRRPVVGRRRRLVDGDARGRADRPRQAHPAARPDARLLRRRAGARPGDLDLDGRPARRQHGLPRLPAGRDDLAAGCRCRARCSSLGDCHAVQGDGEISGTGIEISADVEFTVRVLKGKTIAWPRGEDAEFIMTVGQRATARPGAAERDDRDGALAAVGLRARPLRGVDAAQPVRALRGRQRLRPGLHDGLQGGEEAAGEVRFPHPGPSPARRERGAASPSPPDPLSTTWRGGTAARPGG